MFDLPSDIAEQRHVVIIGGGITGLSTAYYLEQAAQRTGQPIACTIIERDTRLGGKIRSERYGATGEFLIEAGPDSFVAQKPWAIELARELGLADEIMGSQPLRHTTAVLVGGKTYPLPEGMMLVVPTKFWPFLASPLISPLGKLRMALDWFIPARRDGADESLASFIRRRLGNELLQRLAEPLMAGIHSAECERQSVLATFPRFRELESKHGSLIRGMLAAKRLRANVAGALPASPFVTLRHGMESLVEALWQRLAAQIMLGQQVQAVCPQPGGGYLIQCADGRQIAADAVIITTPAFNAADLVEGFQPELAGQLRSIRYVSTATLSFMFREEQLWRAIPGYGVIIPHAEQRQINACTISSHKFAGRAPAGYAIVRAFVGGSRTPQLLVQSDAHLVQLVLAELRGILGVTGEPLEQAVYRWEQGNPQYDVGHCERIAAIEVLQPPGMWLAGAAYGGVGIPDCIRQGREVADMAVAWLAQHAATVGSW
jgi:protoporphyrinogen/coproporphyrinogen III oxidase